MHPLIARYLDLPAAIATLEKADTDATLDSEESAFLAVAASNPRARAAILKAKGAKTPSNDAQQQLIVLATRAATLRLSVDPKIGPRVASARAALEKEGASSDEANDLVAQAVLEEAFGYAEDPETFDADYLAETIDSLAHLAHLTQELVDEWLETFAKLAPAGDRALSLKVAELMLESAWGEGPQPVTPEHLDEAIERLGDTVAETEFPKAVATLKQLLGFLVDKRVVGEERRRRLERILESATSSGVEPQDDEETEEDDEA